MEMAVLQNRTLHYTRLYIYNMTKIKTKINFALSISPFIHQSHLLFLFLQQSNSKLRENKQTKFSIILINHICR